MSTFEENIAKYHNWDIILCNKVIFEYERFLFLKSYYLDAFPSEYIKKLWQYHILNTEHYFNYCMSKFNKIIHHNINDYIDSTNCDNKIIGTINEYKKNFGNFMYYEVWKNDINYLYNLLSPEIPLSKSTDINNNTIICYCPSDTTIPSYHHNKPLDTELKLYFIFSGMYRTNKKNNYLNFHKKIIVYTPKNDNETIDTLKDLIINDIHIDKKLINIKVHPEIKINVTDTDSLFDYSNKLNVKSPLFSCDHKLYSTSSLNDLISKSYNFLIVKIHI